MFGAAAILVLDAAACGSESPRARDSAPVRATSADAQADTTAAALERAARLVVAFLASDVEFEDIRLADTVELRLAPDGGGTRVRVSRDSLRNPLAWRLRAGDAYYSFVPPRLLTRMTTKVGRHFNCQEYALATRAPDLARAPHVGVKLEPGTPESCLQSWNATFVFDTTGVERPVLVAAIYDQWEW
jgi:hypothetical protein